MANEPSESRLRVYKYPVLSDWENVHHFDRICNGVQCGRASWYLSPSLFGLSDISQCLFQLRSKLLWFLGLIIKKLKSISGMHKYAYPMHGCLDYLRKKLWNSLICFSSNPGMPNMRGSSWLHVLDDLDSIIGAAVGIFLSESEFLIYTDFWQLFYYGWI